MNLQVSDIPIVFVSILFAMGLHEAMHAFTSHWLGDTTAKDLGRLTLNPFKHIDTVTTVLLPVVMILLGLPPFFVAKPVPFNPDRVRYDEFGVAMIGVAGPLTNLVLAGLAAVFLRSFGAGFSYDVFRAFVIFITVNTSFFVFNMIPIPPLDGSRLLYAFAPEPLQKAMYQLESMGFSAIILIMFLFFTVLSPVVIGIVDKLLQILI